MSTNRAATPQHFRQKMKKDDSDIVFFVGAVDGTCSATLRAQAVLRLFFAANAVAITPGTKNSAPCCFLNVPFKSLASLQKNDLHDECTSHFILVHHR